MDCLSRVLHGSPLHLGTYALQEDMAWLARRHCSGGLQLDTHALRKDMRRHQSGGLQEAMRVLQTRHVSDALAWLAPKPCAEAMRVLQTRHVSDALAWLAPKPCAEATRVLQTRYVSDAVAWLAPWPCAHCLATRHACFG